MLSYFLFFWFLVLDTRYSDENLDGQTLPINRRQKAYNNGTLVIEQLQRTEDAGNVKMFCFKHDPFVSYDRNHCLIS